MAHSKIRLLMEKELPEAWKISTVKDVVKYQKGKKPKVLKDAYFENSVPYLDIHAFEKGVVRQYADEESSNLIDEKSIGIVWDGARSGWVAKGQKGAIGSTIAKLTPINLDVDYLYRFLQSKFQDINTNTRGTGIPHVDPAYLWSIPIPLPPLREQERIVAKLDTLFAHLEQTKKRLEQIPVFLKQFRQAVLTQAVTGKLTEEWREGEDFKVIENKLNDICLKITDGEHITPKLEEIGIPLLSAKDVRDGYLDFSDTKYVSSETADKSWLRCNPERDDILVVSRGATVGRTTIINTSTKFCLMGSVLLFKPNKQVILPKFLECCFKSPLGLQEIVNRSGATAQQAVYIRDMKDFSVLLPPIEEQTEIVRRVESLFAKADALEARYKVLKELVDKLPQAILGKAFRGEV